MKRYIYYIFSFIFILSIIFSSNKNINIVNTAFAGQELDNAQADKTKLENDLAILEKEIAQKQKELSTQKGQSVSISRDISILTTQIKKSKLNIRSKNLLIKKFGGEIVEKNKKISVLNLRIENIKKSLAQLIRKNREIDDISLLALILSKNSISSAYGDIENFTSIKKSIKKSIYEIRGFKIETEDEKIILQEKKNKELDTKIQLETAKKKVEISEKDKKKLLSISKNKEKEYQKLLNQKAKRKTEILASLFKLRDNSAIPFSKALEYANEASKKTGVRSAFLLAISTQESGNDPNAMVGVNLGNCYLKNKDTGVGIGIKSGKIIKRVMKAPRDTKPFVKLMAKLGRDPYKTAISCPWKNGYGGAMGPLQFIASTWNLVKNNTANYLGIKTADPWNGRDAFMAAAVLLKGNGAISGSYTAERNAACRYYSGKPCTAPKVKNAFYGNSVMKKAKIIQGNIDLLQN